MVFKIYFIKEKMELIITVRHVYDFYFVLFVLKVPIIILIVLIKLTIKIAMLKI